MTAEALAEDISEHLYVDRLIKRDEPALPAPKTVSGVTKSSAG